MPPVLHPTVASIIERLVDDLRAVLGGDLVGLYLYGSAVSGGFDAGVSDLDLVAVTTRDAAVLDLAGLQRVHADAIARDPEWSDRLEIVYVGRLTLAAFRTRPGSLAVISPGEPFHVTGPVSDWAGNWYLVRSTGVPLYGPPPGDVIPPISRHEFVAAVLRYVEYLRAQVDEDLRPGALAYAVLSMCRATSTIATGVPCSKQEGAAWVRDREPGAAWLIDAALACRLSRGTTGFDDERTRLAARNLVRRLAEVVFTRGPMV